METLYSYVQPFFEWLLRSTVQAGIVVCLILLIQGSLRNRLTARWHYALWLILVVRMVLPWAPQSRFSIYNLAAWEAGSKVPANVTSEPDAEPAKPPGESPATRLATVGQELTGTTERQDRDLPAPIGTSRVLADSSPHTVSGLSGVLPFIWLAGALLLGGYIIICNLRLWRAASVECPSTDKETLELLEECRAAIGLRTIVTLVPSETVNTPILLGFVRPRLLVPGNITKKLTREELRYVFLHELAHVKRHDIALGWITALLQVLHWFNPLVWLAFHRMRSNRESACDALVLSHIQGDGAQNYGMAIVSLLEHFSVPQPLPGLAGILESKSQLKRRIAMITQFTNNSYRFSPLAAVLIVILACISLPDPTRGTASANTAPQAKAPMAMRLVQKGVWDDVSMSPDGRYLCDVKGERIAIRELATGEERVIEPTKRTPAEGDPQCPVMSPDNKRIAYLVHREDTGRADVCLIEADGSGQRILYPGIIRSIKEAAGSGPPLPYPGIVRPIQWFPDGSCFLGLRWPDPMHVFKEIQIVSVAIADGSVQVIKTLTGEFFGTTVRLSPDAKYVAYELASKDAPAKHDIFAVDIDSQRETPLIGHPADDRLLDWTPDGNRILFISDRMGPWSAWLLPMAEGQAQGTPELVTRSMGDVRPVGFTENRSYCYRMRYYASDIHTATVNMTTGQLLSAPAPLEAVGSSKVADWSPDGKYLAYCSNSATSSETRVIRIRSLATGQERELANKLTGFDCLRWSPDGRSLLASWLIPYELEDAPLSSRVYRIDAATGETTILLDNKKYNVRMAELSPDGKILYYTTDRIIRREIDTGQEKTIFTYPPKGPFSGFAVSPNGEFIAVGSNEGTQKKAEGGFKKVLLIPSQGGQVTELLRWDEPAGFITHTEWSPDGKTVLFTLHREPVAGKNSKAVNEFWQVSTEGGQPRRIMETDLNIPNLQDFRVHPDGQQIVFSVTTGHGEL